MLFRFFFFLPSGPVWVLCLGGRRGGGANRPEPMGFWSFQETRAPRQAWGAGGAEPLPRVQGLSRIKSGIF